MKVPGTSGMQFFGDRLGAGSGQAADGNDIQHQLESVASPDSVFLAGLPEDAVVRCECPVVFPADDEAPEVVHRTARRDSGGRLLLIGSRDEDGYAESLVVLVPELPYFAPCRGEDLHASQMPGDKSEDSIVGVGVVDEDIGVQQQAWFRRIFRYTRHSRTHSNASP